MRYNYFVLFMVCVISAAVLGLVMSGLHADEEGKAWQWEKMRPSDLRDALESVPVAWVVFSPLEWHGEAMSFGCDPIIGQAIADQAWKQVGGVRIPTVLIGVETDYKYWGEDGLNSRWGLEQITKEHNPGSLYVRPVTFKLVVEDYLYFLERNGFKLVVIMTGHGGTEHVQIMNEISSSFEDKAMKVVFPWVWGDRTPEEFRFHGSGGHADFSEASLLGGVDSNLVDTSKFGVTGQDRKTGVHSKNKDKIDFEKGAKVIEFRAEQIAKEIKKILQDIQQEQ